MTMQQNRMPHTRLLPILLALLVGCLFHASLSWGWGNDSNENAAVFTPQPAAATTPHIVSDGWGGAFITVGSSDGPTSTGIYTQRLDANGSAHTGWPAAGAVQTVTGQEESQSMSDGAGGLYVVWEDYRADGATGDIYIQRYDATGSVHSGWPPDGLAVCTAPDDQSMPQIASDGAGGAIVVWQDLRSGANYDIYAQRIDAAGAVHAGWAPNGVAVSVAAPAVYDKLVPAVVSDGANGAIIAWEDYRNGVDADLYARRIGPDGALLWAGEVGVSAATNDQVNPIVVTDGSGGAIIVWEDYRNDPLGNGESVGGVANIYGQRLDSTGAIVAGGNWVADGIPVAEAAVDQQTPQAISNGSGGAFVAWADDGASGQVTYQIWAQQLAGDGTTTVAGGAPASQTLSGSVDQHNPQLALDGAGGIIAAWEDNRNSAGTGIDIYAQRLDSTLAMAWTNDTSVTTADFDQLTPQLVGDGFGGAIATWNDFRSNNSAEIFAQRINGDGSLSSFTTPSFDVTFVAGSNGSITGPALQTIISGQSAVQVTAVPAIGYDFVNWTGTGGFVTTTTNPLTVANVTAAQTITANFAPAVFTLTFTAGANGSLTGTTPQQVNPGASATAVTAVPATGYHFVNWTGDNGFVTTTANPLTVNPATASQNITANFAIDTFAVTFTAGANGSLTGTSPQQVNYGGSATAVTAVPATGYHFVNWTGDNGFVTTSTNPLTVSNVTAAQNITANFAIDTYTFSFTAGANGSLTGTTSQQVNFGGSTTAVTAVPATGYHFVNWTGDGGFVTTTANPLTINPATATQNITANFAINTYAVTFTAGANGSLSGSTSQTIDSGGSTTAVTATPAAGYHFVNWTGDGGFVTTATNPLTVTNVTAAQNITGNFAKVDGIITGGATVGIADALRLLKIVTNQIPRTSNDMIHGDIAPLDGSGKPKGDGILDLNDVIGILRMVAGLL